MPHCCPSPPALPLPRDKPLPRPPYLSSMSSVSTDSTEAPFSHHSNATAASSSSSLGPVRRAKHARTRYHPVEAESEEHGGWSCPVPGCFGTLKNRRKYDIVRHMKTHLADEKKDFQCPAGNCSYVATQLGNYQSHLRTHGLLPKLRCTQYLLDGSRCSYKCNDPSSLTRHRKLVDHLAPSPEPSAKDRTTAWNSRARAGTPPTRNYTTEPPRQPESLVLAAPIPIVPATSLINYQPLTSSQYMLPTYQSPGMDNYQVTATYTASQYDARATQDGGPIGPVATPAAYSPFSFSESSVSPSPAPQFDSSLVLPPISFRPLDADALRAASVLALAALSSPSPAFAPPQSVTPSLVSPTTTEFSPYSTYPAYSSSSHATTPLRTPRSSYAPSPAYSPDVQDHVSYSSVYSSPSPVSYDWSPSPSPCPAGPPANAISSWTSPSTYTPPPVSDYEYASVDAASSNTWSTPSRRSSTPCTYSGTCRAQTFVDRWTGSALQFGGATSYPWEECYYGDDANH